MNVRNKTQNALDDYFYGILDVQAEDEVTDSPELPDEYITYLVIYDRPTGYADDRITFKTATVDVKYYCRDITKKLTRIEEIINAMKAAGFNVVNDSDIIREKDSIYYGSVIECSWERTV